MFSPLLYSTLWCSATLLFNALLHSTFNLYYTFLNSTQLYAMLRLSTQLYTLFYSKND